MVHVNETIVIKSSSPKTKGNVSNWSLVKYKMENGVVEIERIWLKNLWEICSTSGSWPVKVLYKNKVIVNIRPAIWYSSQYPKMAEWVKRLKAHKAEQLEKLRNVEKCDFEFQF